MIIQIEPKWSNWWTIRNHTLKNNIEKFLIRKAFSEPLLHCNSDMKCVLPDEVLWRKKEAFSDGVGGDTKPFFKHIQEYIRNTIGKQDIYSKCSDDDLEKHYYKNVYDKFYSYTPIDYYWMPKWVNVTNPSARIL